MAFLGTLFRVVEGTIIALNEVNKLLLLFVANRFVTASGAEADALRKPGASSSRPTSGDSRSRCSSSPWVL